MRDKQLLREYIEYLGYIAWKKRWDEPTPESNDSDGDLVPPMDGDDDQGEDNE